MKTTITLETTGSWSPDGVGDRYTGYRMLFLCIPNSHGLRQAQGGRRTSDPAT